MKECPACRRCFPDEINHCPQDGDATTPSLHGEPVLDGRYQLERRIGHGGMGVVFQARHIFLKTAHAIKVILPDLVGNDPMLVTRFRQEALAAAAIRHQNIIAVTDFGVVRGTMPFLVMEFVKGKSLQEIMAEEGAMPPLRAFELIQPICAGIAAAHRQNIVHRDLKPLNVMIQDGVPVREGAKILDFGLAKIESVILHAMAKEPKRRTASADQFVDELRAAMAAASATLKRTGETAGIDPGKTIVSAPPPAQVTFTAKGSTTAFDPMAGTISAASLEQEQQKTLFAQRELAREAEAKRKLAEEEEQKRKAEGQEREAERKHLEELVAQQTKVLEEKLNQLASTMAPKTVGAAGSESAQFHRSGIATVGESSFPAISEVGLVPQKKSRLPLVLGLCVLLLIAGGVGGFFIFRPRAAIKPSGSSSPGEPEAPIKAQLIEIPGGTFQMGRNDGPITEKPAHAV